MCVRKWNTASESGITLTNLIMLAPELIFLLHNLHQVLVFEMRWNGEDLISEEMADNGATINHRRPGKVKLFHILYDCPLASIHCQPISQSWSFGDESMVELRYSNKFRGNYGWRIGEEIGFFQEFTQNHVWIPELYQGKSVILSFEHHKRTH